MKIYFDHEKLNPFGPAPCELGRVAHASRVLVMASSRSRPCPVFTNSQTTAFVGKNYFRATRELPIISSEEADSPSSFEQEQEQEKE
jgi:hypothetical protein